MDIVDGLYYFEEVIDSEYSKKIINKLNANKWKPITKSENSRRVQQYGYVYGMYMIILQK
jgi:hypothetical protein